MSSDFARLTRRGLLGTAIGLLGACRSGGEPEATARPSSALPGPTDAPALQFVTVSDMPEADAGGTAVVLLHGWGAEGDDLVSLAERLKRPRSRFFVPAAPLSRPGGGRAWWHLDANRRPPHVLEPRVPDGYSENPAVSQARRAVQTLLRDIRRRYRPQRLVLGGFSQGAMLSLDVALAPESRVDRVAALSGVLIADSVPALLAAKPPMPQALVTHGRSDRVLPFAAGEAIAKLLSERGASVTFVPFEGGHQIPPEVVQALGRLIYE